MAAKAAAQALTSLAKVSFGLGATVLLAENCLYNVDAGEAAALFSMAGGIKDDVKLEGTHFKIPFVETPRLFNIRAQPRMITTKTGTNDLQTVAITLRVLFRPIPEKIPVIINQVGVDYDAKVLPSISNEVLKSVVAQYNADQLLTMRDKVSKEISNRLNQRAEQFNIMLDDVSITHLNFSREFTEAIEHKQVAQQDAERSKFLVMQAEQERKVKVVNAEADSESAILFSDALEKHGEGLLELMKIDAAVDIAQTLSQSRNVAYLPSSGTGMLLNLGAGN